MRDRYRDIPAMISAASSATAIAVTTSAISIATGSSIRTETSTAVVISWRRAQFERGFAEHYRDVRDDRSDYDRGPDRYRDDDRYHFATGDAYFDRSYERGRDDHGRDVRFRDREYGGDYWDDYPWSRDRR